MDVWMCICMTVCTSVREKATCMMVYTGVVETDV